MILPGTAALRNAIGQVHLIVNDYLGVEVQRIKCITNVKGVVSVLQLGQVKALLFRRAGFLALIKPIMLALGICPRGQRALVAGDLRSGCPGILSSRA
jgi:hypothetical protein